MNKGIQNIFSAIPQTYELINHVLTLGFDTPIRRYTAKLAASGSIQRTTQDAQRTPERSDGRDGASAPAPGGTQDAQLILDACTGTGEMARYLGKYAKADTLVMASDFTLPMLRYAQRRNGPSTRFTNADSVRLPFKDNTFDVVTISFATRNINVSLRNLTGCLKEFHRVLKPGGRFVNLETSQPRYALLRRILHLFVRAFVRPVGTLISGSRPAYTYLSQTIPRFYDADELSGIILEAGFGECKYKHLMGGIVAIHQGTKK